jgi:hypothetical protein
MGTTVMSDLASKYTKRVKYRNTELIGVRVMVFNATFNNFSVISWQSVLLVMETEVPTENPRPAASH